MTDKLLPFTLVSPSNTVTLPLGRGRNIITLALQMPKALLAAVASTRMEPVSLFALRNSFISLHLRRCSCVAVGSFAIISQLCRSSLGISADAD